MLVEVYSGHKLSSISEEIRKTARKAWRLAPASMIGTAAEVIETHLYTQQFDEAIALNTMQIGGVRGSDGSVAYIKAMRRDELIAEKRQQLYQMRALASSIELYLNKSALHLGLKMTSKIAKKSGVYNLHQFLVRASSVLRDTQDLTNILDEITETELLFLDKIENQENPFAFMDQCNEHKEIHALEDV